MTKIVFLRYVVPLITMKKQNVFEVLRTKFILLFTGKAAEIRLVTSFTFLLCNAHLVFTQYTMLKLYYYWGLIPMPHVYLKKQKTTSK
jgi:hypothetical protein